MRALTLQAFRSSALRFAGALVIAGSGLIPVLPAGAQPPPAAVPPGGPVRGMTPELEDILRHTVAAYRKLESYQDNGRLTIRQVTGRVTQLTRMPNKTIFRRPNLLHLTGGMQTINCNGKELQIVLDGLAQYQQGPAPERLTMEHLRAGAPGAGLDEGFPEILEFLMGTNVYARWIGQIRQIELEQHDEPKKIDGRPVHAIAYETVHRALVRMWIDQETHLLLRYDTDYTHAQRPANAPPPRPGEILPTMEIVLQLHPVMTGGKPEQASPSPFAPRADLVGMKKVDRFDPGTGPGAPPEGPGPEAGHPLIGNPMPEILGSGMDGKTVDSSKLFAKKAALVFYWAPVGDAGSLASLQMIQRLVDRFGSRKPGLAVIGVCGAGRDAPFVKDLLRAKKATYPVVIDPDGRFMRAFAVSTTPAFFLAGPDGTVREVLDGAPHEAEAELVKALEELLGGGN